MIKAICFDAGGTLLYTQGETFSTRLCGLLGTTLASIRPLVLKHFYTKQQPFSEALTAFCTELGTNLLLRPEARRLLETPAEAVSLYPDAQDLAQMLRGYRCATISNATPWGVADLNTLFGAALFEVEITSYEVGAAKPDPAIFLAAAQRLQLAPAEIVMVGDSLVDDMRGAKGVKWNTIYIQRCKEKMERDIHEADAVIASLAQVRQVIEQF